MFRMLIIILLLAAILFPLTAAAEGNVPKAAAKIAKLLDQQIIERLELMNGSMSSKNETIARSRFMIMGTTAANINNLNQASGLARQMTEEISSWLINRGYAYDEIRKGSCIRFVPKTGEFILTRDVAKLANRQGTGQAILAGTYAASNEDIRFTYSLISVNGGEVLARASATVPITDDLRPLLMENLNPKGGTTPSVYTKLK